MDGHDLFFVHSNRRAWCDRGLLVPEEKPVGQLNRIVVEDANRHGLTGGGGGGGSAGGGFGAPVPGTLNQINSNPRSQAINHGRITVNPGHHGFENTTIVANIKFGPKGNVLLAGGNDLSNSNTGQSLLIFPYYVPRELDLFMGPDENLSFSLIMFVFRSGLRILKLCCF